MWHHQQPSEPKQNALDVHYWKLAGANYLFMALMLYLGILNGLGIFLFGVCIVLDVSRLYKQTKKRRAYSG